MPLDSISVTQLISAPFMKLVSTITGFSGLTGFSGFIGLRIGPPTLGLHANSNIINTIGWSIGYRLGIYKNITNYVNSEGLFDAGGDRYIYVSIDDYQYNNNPLNIVCFDNSIMDKNIIAKIPMVNGKLSLTVDDNTSYLTKTRKYNGPVNLRNLFIKIIDQFGHIIDLNNMDYSFSLELEVLYEGFNFKDINS